jgi:carbon storage regulator CsrA
MLVLSRKSTESIVVGGSNGFEHVLKITVLEIRNGHVKLGLDVNRGVPVHREEVWERIRECGDDESKGGVRQGIRRFGSCMQRSLNRKCD